ncbi:hypothetical protein [Apibacter sp. B2966]|nr:hypothetical protein [Apibacter sp. B2966]
MKELDLLLTDVMLEKDKKIKCIRLVSMFLEAMASTLKTEGHQP